MRTYLDCFPCFLKQALEAGRIAGIKREDEQKRLLCTIVREIEKFSLKASPPEIGRIVHFWVRKSSKNPDPFKEIKKQSNHLALKLYPELKKEIENSAHKLLKAVKLSIAGNVIDYGANHLSPSLDKSLDSLSAHLKKTLKEIENQSLSCFEKFAKALKRASIILYLADNAGEVVFDRLLLEELVSLKKQVIFAVRGAPIINDALIEDAYFCQIDRYAQILSNGSDAPGTVLNLCSPDFIEAYQKADLVISKGQGNFESLSEEKKQIYFLLKVKCSVLAQNIGAKIGSAVLIGRDGD
ncbi:MAG: hypothetical protein DRP75_01595 [Candidatus Omnitrophota bacterium]|nr:MAG: hypothetical protein DRP75_01595 [Candidatus Omnitrophota bacterium]